MRQWRVGASALMSRLRAPRPSSEGRPAAKGRDGAGPHRLICRSLLALTWTSAPGIALFVVFLSLPTFALAFRNERFAIFGGYAVVVLVGLLVLATVT
jgi:hypothetical protein